MGVEAKRAALDAGNVAVSGESSNSKKKRKVSATEQEESANDAPSQAASKRQRTEDCTDASMSSSGVNEFRAMHNIIVDSHCPPPFDTFDAAKSGFSKTILKELCNLGFSAPTPIQAQGWPLALQGKDMVAVAKT